MQDCNYCAIGYDNYRNHLITHFDFSAYYKGNQCTMCHKVFRDQADAKRHVALTHKLLQMYFEKDVKSIIYDSRFNDICKQI